MVGERILIVDDEATIRFGVAEFFRAHGYTIDEAATGAAAEESVRQSQPDVVIIDYSLNVAGYSGLDLLRRLREFDAQIPVIILTGHGSIDLAVQAMKDGAEHFLTKPVELAALRIVVDRAIDQQRRRKKGLARSRREDRQEVDVFRGRSEAILRLKEEATRVLPSDSPIFILGETGAGKGVLARWLHQRGPRAAEAFVDLNCAGLARDLLESELFGHERGAFTGAVTAKQGLLEIAHRGTVFLDEVGDMDLAVQPKLLKVLEEKRYRRLGDVNDRRVDVRIITATHHDLEALVEQGRFRRDLFYRIGILPLYVPPLRDRREDIALLACDFAEHVAMDLGRPVPEISPEGVAILESYGWPGNVRELRNVVERAVLVAGGDPIGPRQLGMLTRSSGRMPSAPSASPANGSAPSLTLVDLEREHIQRVLKDSGGRVEQAATRLGIPRSSLYNKLKKYGLASKV